MRVKKTDEYREWIDGLKDQAGRARVLMRVHRNLTEGGSELKVDVGPGYRGLLLEARGQTAVADCWRRQVNPGQGHCKGTRT